MAVQRFSVEYTKYGVNKYVVDPRDYGGRAVALPFSYTVVTEVTTDTVVLVALPGLSMVVGLDLYHDAAASTAVIIGDAGNTARFMASQSWAAAGTVNALAVAGQNYRIPSQVEVPAFLTWVTVNPTAAATLKGVFWVVPGA